MPSPLREQIACATREALRASGIGEFVIDTRLATLGATTDRVADEVLPLVEAAVAAERLRLHTQLRDQITALDVWPKWPDEPERVSPPDEAMVGRADVLALLEGSKDG